MALQTAEEVEEQRKEARATMRSEAMNLDADTAAHEIASDAFTKLNQAILARSPGGFTYAGSKIAFDTIAERDNFIRRLGASFTSEVNRLVNSIH